ncbi:acyl thioesterase [Fusarium pseudoanthophilum]|uniref:Acyl thioesterase n=1 Tax=Fusarium pseudoanthophilum TaxID=48495 RepID=A0A8H5NMP1_9HYPO|nr:acyl thioesterase [Fusarium pseudoanthophilum]
MSLAVLLSLDHSIGGNIGISGFLLTYQDDLESVVSDEVDSDNPFSHPNEPQDTTADASAVKAQERKELFWTLTPWSAPRKRRQHTKLQSFLAMGRQTRRYPVRWETVQHSLFRMQGIRLNGSAMITKVTGTRCPIK